MIGKEAKKKQLKTLITFHSPEVYERAVAEPNTSALGEALFARHFGIEIEGDTIQAKQRLAVLEGVIAAPAEPARVPAFVAGPAEDVDETEGDLDDEPLILPGQAPAAAEAPLTLPDQPQSASVETAPIVPTKPVDETLPDRPVDQPVTPPAGAFEPVRTTQPAAEATPAPSPAAEQPVAPVVEPAPAPITTEYTVGTRICGQCGADMGSDPYCLNCL